MPIVNIPNYGPVSFPEGMPEAEIQSRARDLADKFAKKAKYEADYRDLGLGKLFYGGLRRGMSGFGSTVTDLVPGLIGAGFGLEDYAKQQFAEAEEKRKAIQEQFPPAFKSFRDIGGIGQGAGFVSESLGELTTDMLAMLTGAGTLGAVGRRAAVKGVEEAAAKRAAETAAKKQMDEAKATAYADRLKQRMLSSQAGEIAKTQALTQGAGLAGVHPVGTTRRVRRHCSGNSSRDRRSGR